MQKKLLSILLVLCMLLSMFPMALPVAAEEVVEETENTESTETTTPAEVVEIGTADELIALMGDSTKWAGNYKLTAPIDLSTAAEGSVQAPIGNGEVAFTGTFDGQGNTISGLNIAGTSAGTGLFGVVSDDGDKTVITNFTIEGSVTSSANFVGGAVGVVCGEAEISKITSNLTTLTAGGTGRLGGIVGGIVCNGALPAITAVEKLGGYTVTISECVNNANITATGSCDRVSGILGTLSSATGTRAATHIVIEDCVNNGDISSPKGGAAGIAGMLEGGAVAGNTITVRNCENNGDVVAKGTRAGGIAATLDAMSADNEILVENCVNNGSVTASQVPAGIIGYLFASTNIDANMLVTKCENYGDITATIINSKGAAKESWAGGIVGYAKDTATANGLVTISYCYNEGTVSANANATVADKAQIGGIVGYSYGVRVDANRQIYIKSCWNAGDVTIACGDDVGGILGIGNGCFVYDCLNTGNVSATKGGAVGGIVARTASSGAVARCYSTGAVSATGSKQAVVGKFDNIANYTHGALFYTADVADENATKVDAANVGVASYFTDLNAEGQWTFTDNGPELEYFHEHDNTAKFVAVEGGHVTACYCNSSATFGKTVAEHVMVDGVCEDCGYIACAHENTEEQVTLEPTCTDLGFYSVYCNDCQSFVSQGNEIAIDESAHYKGTHIVNDYDNSGAIQYVYDCCGAVAHEDYDYFTEIYVSTAGNDLTEVTGNVGDSEENAFKDFEDAMVYAAASATVNGEATIYIVDQGVVSTSNYKTPAYDGLITITGGNIHFTAGTKRWFANGDVKFENITITNNTTTGMRWFAQNHYFEMGEGIVMGNEGTLSSGTGYPAVNNVKLYLHGGFEGGNDAMNTNLVIRSGDYWYVGGWNQVPGDNKDPEKDLKLEKAGISAGVGKITIGKTNPEDYLFTNYLVGFTTGKQLLSADSKATIVIDGDVDMHWLIPGTQNELSAASTMLYETDIVLKNGANINAVATESMPALDITGAPNTCKNTKVTVYVDERSEDAIADAAIFTTDDCFTKMKTDYTESTYVAYCAEYFGHNDADEDDFCDECDASLNCVHVNSTKVVVTAGTCTVPGTYNAVCADCGQNVYNADQTEETVDLTNHVDAEGKTSTTWVANENGTFDLVCDFCNNKVVEGAEYAYVHIDPALTNKIHGTATAADTNLGTSYETAVATLEEAIERLKTVGGKVIFDSVLEVKSAGIRNLPAWEKEITFTYGHTTTGFRITAHGAVINFNGPTKLENFLINGGNSEKQNNSDGGYYNIPVLCANWNDFTVGTGLTTWGAVYFVAGNIITSSNIEENRVVDLATGTDENGNPIKKNVKIVFNRTTAAKISDNQPAVATFDRVYLGARNRTMEDVTVKNVHIDFESVGATFNLVFAGSVSGSYKLDANGNRVSSTTTTEDKTVYAVDTQMENCSIKTVFGGKDHEGTPCDAYIRHFQVGMTNVDTGDAYLDKLEIEFNGTAYMQKTTSETHKDTDVVKTKGFSTRNVKDLTVKISDGADRVYEYTSDGKIKVAEKYNAVPFYFSKSPAYVPDGTETISITYGSHSFLKGVDYPAYNEMYTVNETVNDECTFDEGKITTEATPEKPGVLTYTCTVCGRTKTEEVAYVCTAHVYVAKADGTYYCANNCGAVEAPEADAVIAVTPATVENGVATVNVVIDATIWGAKFSVNAPAGFTLTGVTSTLGNVVEGANAFTFTGADDLALPYNIAVVNMATDENSNLVNGTLENAVVATLTFAVDNTVVGGTYLVNVTADEVYTVDEAAVDTVVVAAEVTVVVVEEECAHENKTTTNTATCEEAGVETVTCDDCGEKISETAVEALGHAWDDGEVTTPAAPGVAGEKTYTCTRCGETKTEAIDALAVVAYVDGVAYASVADAVAAVAAFGTVEVVEGTEEAITANKVFYLAGDFSKITLGEGYKVVTTTKDNYTGDVEVVNLVRPVEETKTTAYPIGISYSLASAIRMNAVTLANSFTNYKAFYGEITVNTVVEGNVVPRTYILTTPTTSGAMYQFTMPMLAAKEMGDEVVCRIYAIDANGKVFYNEKTTSVASYVAGEWVKTTSTDTYKALLAGMLNYGAAAQVSFNYRTDAMSNEILLTLAGGENYIKNGLGAYTEGENAVEYSKTKTNDGLKNAITRDGLQLTCVDSVIVKVIVMLDANKLGTRGTEGLTIVGTYTGMADNSANTVAVPVNTWETLGSNMYRFSISGIAAKNMRSTVTFALYRDAEFDANGNLVGGDKLTGDFTTGVEEYATATMAGTNTAEKTLLLAILDYADAAKAHFNP